MWSSGACVNLVYMFFFMTTGTVRIQIVVLLTSPGLHSIHMVNTRFLYNVPCVSRTRMSLLVSRNGLPYSPIADFTDITSYMNIFCNPLQCAIDSSFKVNNDTCHLWSAEHPPLQGSGTLSYAISSTIILYNSVMLPCLKTHDSSS